MTTPKEPGAAEAVERVLARLAARTPELDRLDDEIGRLIVRTEKALRALKIGMRLSVSTRRAHEDWSEYLAFDKVNGAWRLTVDGGPDESPDSWSTTPLSDCDRETRLAAFSDGLIERLLLTAADQLDEAIKERQMAIENGQAFVGAIEHASTRRGTP